MLNKNQKAKIFPWIIVCSGMLFYAYNYLLRTSPSTMMAPLVSHFGITATAFGSLAACYYYIYTPMQIPVGILIDRYNIRWILTVASAIAVFGLFIFMQTDSFFVACIARMLIGFGCAFAYIGVIKLATNWLPTNKFATAAGIATAVAMITGAGADIYLVKMVDLLGYQTALHTIALMGVFITIMLAVMIRKNPRKNINTSSEETKNWSVKELMIGLKTMVSNKQMWIISLIACFAYLPASVFLDVWGIPYLETAKHFSARDASLVISFMFVGWIISAPIIGMLSDKIEKRSLPLKVCSLGAAITTACLLLSNDYHFGIVAMLLFFFGFFAGAQPLVFSLGRENNPKPIAATATAFVNCLTMVGGVIFQPVVGILIDWHHQGHFQGMSGYTSSDYFFAFSILPLTLFITFIATFFLKETHCKFVSSTVEEEKLKLAYDESLASSNL